MICSSLVVVVRILKGFVSLSDEPTVILPVCPHNALVPRLRESNIENPKINGEENSTLESGVIRKKTFITCRARESLYPLHTYKLAYERSMSSFI